MGEKLKTDIKKVLSELKVGIQDIHLYSDKMEAFIRLSIWIISWLGGILALNKTAEQSAHGGAYFLFALTLAAEFVPQILKKKFRISKLAHAIFCAAILIILAMAFGALIGIEVKVQIMFAFSKAIIIYMMIDVVLLWLGTSEKSDTARAPKVDDGATSLETHKFIVSGHEGNLGEIKEGRNDE